VLLRDEEKTWYIAVGDISLVEAEGNYSRIHFDGGATLVHRSLTAVEARLPATTFFRANRSQLVNTSHIASVEPWFSQTLKATLRNAKTIEFSRRSSLLFRETRGL
jgi:two-component system LytT family response regulator